MAHNYYSEINLHITWHAKDSLPILTPIVEPLVHRYIKQRLANEEGIYIHEIGGIETHIHVVVSVPPTIAISEWVGQLKGASAHEVNQQIGLRDKTLQWQTGYGVVRSDSQHWMTSRTPVNGRDNNERAKWTVGGIAKPVLKHGPNTASRTTPINGRE
jgi:putative transposase